MVTKLININSPFLEQLSFSGLRYLYWVFLPILYVESISFVATLTVINLLNSSMYSTFIGTPSFYKIESSNFSNFDKSFLPISFSFFLLGLASILISFFPLSLGLLTSNTLIIFLFILCSAFSDWNRKIALIQGKFKRQNTKSVLGIIFWLSIVYAIHLKLFHLSFLQLTLVYVCLSFVVNFNTNYFSLIIEKDYMKYFEQLSVLKHYITVAVISYLSGNILFYINSSYILEIFLVLRNYLTPIIIFAIYIETNGAIEFNRAKNKLNIFLSQFAIFSGITLFFILIIGYFLSIYFEEFNFTIYLFASLITGLATLIKIPTVALRLQKKEYVITNTYFISAIFILPIIIWNKSLPFNGLELISLSYIMTFVLLVFSFKKNLKY